VSRIASAPYSTEQFRTIYGRRLAGETQPYYLLVPKGGFGVARRPRVDREGATTLSAPSHAANRMFAPCSSESPSHCGPNPVFWFDDCVSRASVGKLGRPPVSVSAQSRTRILDAARLCFVDRGYDQTTMKDIAATADMTAGALYHHFASKQELFAAVFRRHQAEAFSAFEVALAA
jgi:hypothetical protein